MAKRAETTTEGFTPVEYERKSDGKKLTARSAAQEVQLRFDGFAPVDAKAESIVAQAAEKRLEGGDGPVPAKPSAPATK